MIKTCGKANQMCVVEAFGDFRLIPVTCRVYRVHRVPANVGGSKFDHPHRHVGPLLFLFPLLDLLSSIERYGYQPNGTVVLLGKKLVPLLESPHVDNSICGALHVEQTYVFSDK
jgi:hypothetical protein